MNIDDRESRLLAELHSIDPEALRRWQAMTPEVQLQLTTLLSKMGEALAEVFAVFNEIAETLTTAADVSRRRTVGPTPTFPSPRRPKPADERTAPQED